MVSFGEGDEDRYFIHSRTTVPPGTDLTGGSPMSTVLGDEFVDYSGAHPTGRPFGDRAGEACRREEWN